MGFEQWQKENSGFDAWQRGNVAVAEPAETPSLSQTAAKPQRKWWEGGSVSDPAVLRTSKFIPGAAKQLLAADVDKWAAPDWESSIPDEKDWYYDKKKQAVNLQEWRQGLAKRQRSRQNLAVSAGGLEGRSMAGAMEFVDAGKETYIRSGAKPIGAKENLMRGDVLAKLPFSTVKAAEMLDVLGSVKRLEAEDFSKYTEAGIDAEKGKLRDQRVVDEYFKALQEQSIRGKTFMADVGSGVADLPAWMVEFYVTGGLAKLASKGVGKAGLKFMGKYVKTQAGRHAVANALRVTAATVITPTIRTMQQPHRVVEGAVENMIQGDQSIEAWLKAGVSQNIENWSEAMGGQITKVLRKVPVTKQVMGVFDDFAKARYIASGGTAEAYARAIRAGGYDGLVGELGEEWLGGMSQALLGTETFGAEQTGDFVKDTIARLEAATVVLFKETPKMATVLSVPGATQVAIDIPGQIARAQKGPPAAKPTAAKVAPVAKPPTPPVVAPPKVTKAQEAAGKQPWEMTQEEFGKLAQTFSRENTGIPIKRGGVWVVEDGAENVFKDFFGPTTTEKIAAIDSNPLVVNTPRLDITRYRVSKLLLTDKELSTYRESGRKPRETIAQNLAEQEKLWAKAAKQKGYTSIHLQAEGETSSIFLVNAPTHKQIISQALSEGKPVPAEVLKDYPDLAQPPTEAKGEEVKKAEKEIEHEQEAIIEPAPSPAVDQGKAGEPVPDLTPTGKLDPTDPTDAREITKQHANWVARGTKREPQVAVGGIYTTKWDKEAAGYVVDSVEYTSKQIDAAYRLVQKSIPSPMPDVNLFAMPGKEKQLSAIAQKMSRMKAPKKEKTQEKLPKPRILPKAKTKKEDHIKAVYVAAAKESKRYALGGVFVESGNLVATDGRRMFMAKGVWGKGAVYLDAASLSKGVLGKATTKGGKFPKWQDIVPLVHKSDAIVVDDLEKMWRHVIQASLLTREDSPGLVILKNKDGSLGFATASAEIGHSEINVYPGAKILAGFNLQFLLDSIAFHAKRGDTVVEFYFQEADRPLLTRSPDKKTSTILMPVNMGEVSEGVKERISEKPPAPAEAKKPGKQGGGGAIGDVAVGAPNEIDRGRIKVALEPGGKPQTARQIVDFVSRAFNIPVRGKATHGKHALGWFDAKAVGIRQKDVRSLTTAMHEIGHHIDWTLNKRLSLNPPKGTADELMALGRALYGDKKPPGGYKSEGWAEFIRMHLTGDNTKDPAPNLHKWFHEIYLPGHQDTAKKLAKAQQMITLWRFQGSEARVESQINRRSIKGTIADRLERGILWLETKWFDKFGAIRLAVKATGEDLRPDLDPFKLATARASKEGAIGRQMVKEYTIDTAGNYTGISLREAIAPVRKDIKAFTRYMMAARARNLWKRGINPGISQADAEFVFEKYDSDLWRDATKAVTDWNHRVLDYLVEAGGLESEAAKRMKELNPVYIPFMRAFKVGEIQFKGGTGVSAAKPGKGVKAIKGSGRQIIDPLESMIQQTEKLISVASKTEVALALAKLANKPGMAQWIWKVPAPKQATQFQAEQLKKEITRIAVQKLGLDVSEGISSQFFETWDEMLTVYTNAGQFFGKENIVAIVIDGKKQFFEVHPELYRAIEGLDKWTFKPIMDLLFGKTTRTLRLGATGLNAAFGLIRNPIRDALTFTVLAKHAKAGPLSAAKGVVEDVANTPNARKFKALGGKMSGMVLFDRTAAQHLRGELLATTIAEKTVFHATHPINALRELFGITEAGTRIGEFGPALKAAEKKYGKGSKAAAIEALNAAQDVTTNFTRSGEYGRVLNQMIPFFNAGIQGPSKIARTFRHRPIETMIKALIALTLPALWLWWRNRDKEWWKNLPLWEKTSYLHIEVPGEDKIIRLPVPFELGHIFQSIPVAVLDAQYQDDPDSMKGTMVEVMENANPFDWPALVGPLIDVISNENFAGIPIVSRSMEGKLPEDRVKAHTTELMKELGKRLKLSPAQLEHMINAYSGGIYLRGARAFEKRGDSPRDIPVIGTLFVRDPFAPKAQVERFYDRSDLLNQRKQSGRIVAGSEEDKERLLLGRIRRKLSPLWKELRTAESVADRKVIWNQVKTEIQKRK